MDPDPELSDSVTYDITTWALPYAYGMKAYAMTTPLAPTAEWALRTAAANEWAGDEPVYAYAIHYDTDLGTPVLAGLLKEGVLVGWPNGPWSWKAKRGLAAPWWSRDATTKPFGMAWRRASMRWPKAWQAFASGAGPRDGRFRPRLGSLRHGLLGGAQGRVVTGDAVSSLSFGEVWHHMEEVWQYPMTAVWGLESVDWDECDVVVLPRGWYDVDDGMAEAMGEWVREGGQIVLLDGACRLGMERWGLSRYSDDEDQAERQDERDAHGAADRYAPYALSERNGIRSSIPGAVYAIELDATHPLAYGYGDTYWSMKTSGSRFAHLDGGHNVGVLRGEADPVSGFAGSRANQGLRESLSFGVHDMGRGHVVYLADNVMFRAFWKDGHKFFANAVFFGSIM